MALTNAELARLTAIEEMLNTLQTVVSNLATKQMLRQINLQRQTELDTLNAKINELEAIVQTLQNAL